MKVRRWKYGPPWTDLYSRWKDWVLSGNAGFLPAFSTVGGDIPAIPLYLFLENGWRVVPQQADHTLTVVGGVFEVQGGGDPFVDPAGSYKIRINRQVPGIAIGYSAGAGGGGPSETAIAAAVRAELNDELVKLSRLHRINGLEAGVPLLTTDDSRVAGDIVQQVSDDGTTTTMVLL